MKLGKYKKGIIIVVVAVVLILLILLTADRIKNIYKNNTQVSISKQEEKITSIPNEPTLSAGMIPVKYDGNNLVICKNDSSWYNYGEGTPAYMMLNDGTYQSEEMENMTGKKIASENIGRVVESQEQGSIYIWIPRYAQNTETNEIVYLEQERMIAGKYNKSTVFTYETENMDFSLAGIWIEKEPLANESIVNEKINNMTVENNDYGLIANTVVMQMTEEDKIAFSGMKLDIFDLTNTNRTVLKIIETNKIEPIKAKAYYDEIDGKIKIEVTFSKNGIAQIEDENGNILSVNSITANTGEEVIENGIYRFIVADNIGNKKEVELRVEGLSIYVIPNLEKLKKFRDEVNAGNNFSGITVIQSADIEVNEGKYTLSKETGEIEFASDAEQWVPIADYANNSNLNFAGTYDGNNHTISGIYIDNSSNQYKGLFGYVNGGTIKNLNIESSKIVGSSYIGGICGSAKNKSLISRCHNGADITASSSIVGGICGYTDSSILECYNTGDIEGNGSIGGICGEFGNTNLTISACYNTGNIISNLANSAAGICGNYTKLIVRNCYNIGSVKNGSGILGTMMSGGSGVIENCYNAGSIVSELSKHHVSGICYNAITINNCYNSGDIISDTGNATGICYLATRVNNCYNSGDITCNQSAAGGIASVSTQQINGCYNIGNITSQTGNAGGIASINTSGFRITNCYNAGNITSQTESTGGITANSGGIVNQCYNMGKISSTKDTGGIIGYFGNKASCTKCYYETGTADYGIASRYSDLGCTQTTREEIISKIQELDIYKEDIYHANNLLPIQLWQTDNDKLNLINEDNAFVEDKQNTNHGYPILAWQVK